MVIRVVLAGVFALAGIRQTPLRPVAIDPLTTAVPASARMYVQVDPLRPGRMAAWREPDGTIRVVYQYRNPDGCITDLRSTILVDVVGGPIW